MAWRAKDATVLLVDVGRAMGASAASGSDGAKVSKADVALRVARNYVQQKLLFLPRHEVGVVFFGTAETKNDLQQDGYEHVYVARDGKVSPADLDALQRLTKAPQGGAESDAVNGLIVALDLLIKKTSGAKWNQSVMLLTDIGSVRPGDPDLLECAKQLEATGTSLQVTLFGGQEAGPWYEFTKACPQIKLVPLARLVRDCSLSVKPVELRAKVRLQMVISPDLQIPVGIYSRTTRVTFPTLKKRSKTAMAMPAEHRTTDAVISERTHFVADDPDGEAVKKEDWIKGHRYGQSIVPMSGFDEAALAYTCERTLTALGFAPRASVGPEHSVWHVEAVAADRGDHWALLAFESLLDAMLAEDLVLVARYCFRNNSQPRMVALFPNKGSKGVASTFELLYLPFFEDIREWTCASLPTPSAEQRDAVAALVDAMDLERAAPVGDELLRPEDTHNPCLTRFYSFLTQRALDPAAGVPPPGPESLLAVERPQQVAERLRVGQVGERLREKFVLAKVEKMNAKTKRFWREAILEKRKDAATGEVDPKRVKIMLKEGEEDDEKGKVKMELGYEGGAATSSGMAAPVGVAPAGASGAARVHIGSVHPERDFERWLANRAGGVDVVAAAIQQMCDIVERLAEEGDDFHGKALSCLSVLRRGCVREAEAAEYNEFARRLRRGGTHRRARFWEKARDSGLGLITDAETATSTVTADEARAFLAGEDRFLAPAPPATGEKAILTEGELEAMIE